MKLHHSLLAVLFTLSSLWQVARADAISDEIAGLEHGWAKAYYEIPDAGKDEAFTALRSWAELVASKYPDRADALIWQAIITSTHAKYQGIMTAGRSAKKARDLLLAAEKLDPTALDGSVYTSLGSLYYKVPGWPLSFGDKDKARNYLERALQINPDGIDPNFFFAEFLAETGDSERARSYLEKAMNAPARPGREDADAGRKLEIQALRKQLEG